MRRLVFAVGSSVPAVRYSRLTASRLPLARFSQDLSTAAMADRDALLREVHKMYDYDSVTALAPSPESVFWVFGYGSILFKQGFAAGQTVAGRIKGWRRVFYQRSTDHRGTPDAPGRTVTLVPDERASTWGVACKLPDDIEARRTALQELEWREKQYDRKVYAPIYDADGSIIVDRVLTYVGSSDSESNVNWGGEATAGELAEIIAHAHGPSGPNCEYLYNLADGLRALGVDDPHVFELDALVRQLRGDEAHHEALPSPPAPPPATQAGGKASCSNLPTQ